MNHKKLREEETDIGGRVETWECMNCASGKFVVYISRYQKPAYCPYCGERIWETGENK